MMSISDIITLLTLIIAVIAIFSEKNRKHLLLKFHAIDYFLLFIAFLLINYFVFYISFYTRNIYISKLYFQNYGFKDPSNWAYGITLMVLLYIFYKINYGFFPYTKRHQVALFYRKLIEDNEITFLLDLIERYHKKDIIRYIRIERDVEEDFFEQFKKESFREKGTRKFVHIIQILVPWSCYNKNIYSQYVFHNILHDPAFIELAANKRPYFFPDLIEQLNK